MKKICLMILTLSLTACANNTHLFSSDNSGKYPINYAQILEKDVGIGFIPLFELKKHKKTGWFSCFYNQEKNKKLAVTFKDEKVIEKMYVDENQKIENICEIPKFYTDVDLEERSSAYSEELLKVQGDSSKHYLFGNYPKEPLVAIKAYLFDKINYPLSAKFDSNYIINPTYYIDSAGKMIFAYDIKIKIDTQNKHEKYEGFKTYHFTVKDDVVVNHFIATF